MKRALLLLLALLLVPSTASAYVVYDITCDNVANIRIERLRDTVGNITSYGWYHTVHFELKPEAAEAFVRLRDATPKIPIRFRDKIYPRENIRVISHRRTLPVRASALTEHGDHGITFIAVREREAFQLAEEVCPALVPAQVLVEGRLVDPDPANPPVPEALFPPPTGDLVYDISCENIARVLIVRSEDSFLGLHTPQGYVYSVSFRLKPDASDRFQPILNESRKIIGQNDATGAYSRKGLFVTAHGQPLRNDVPERKAHGEKSVNTLIFQQEDALATARFVCPTAPIQLIIPPRRHSPGQN